MTLVNQIEKYIKSLLSQSGCEAIELKRSDLAETFMCVPSQINYVLETRFSIHNGYLVESKRGGGGYVRIIKLSPDKEGELLNMINSASGRKISQVAGESLIDRLTEEKFLTEREGILLKSMINSNVLSQENSDMNVLRGELLKTVLLNLLRDDF